MTTEEIQMLDGQLNDLTTEKLMNAYGDTLLALLARVADVLATKNIPDDEGDGWQYYDFLLKTQQDAEYYMCEKYPEMMH